MHELAKKRLQSAYVGASEKTKQAVIVRLSQEFGVSVATIRRYEKSGSWEALRQASLEAKRITAAIARVQGLTANPDSLTFDPTAALAASLQILSNKIPDASPKSLEGMAIALAKASEVYLRYNPPTMEKLAELAFSIPDFDPQKFAQLLRRKYEKPG